MEIPVSSVSSIQISGDAMLSEGGSSAFGLYGVVSVSGVAKGTISDCRIYDGITWSSSVASVADIGVDGICKAEGLGSTVITATIGTGDDAISTQREVMVVHEGTTITGVKTPDIVTEATSIGDGTYKNDNTITNFVIGENIETGCKNLKKVKIGSNVTEIKQKAFANCTSITSITIPAKTVKLGNNLFTGCKNLKTITIKTKKLTAKSVSKNAFKGVSSKTVIKVPKKLKKTYTKLFRKKGLSKKVKIKAIR